MIYHNLNNYKKNKDFEINGIVTKKLKKMFMGNLFFKSMGKIWLLFNLALESVFVSHKQSFLPVLAYFYCLWNICIWFFKLN